MVKRANARMMELRNPILSAMAPVKVGSKYKNEEYIPEMMPACTSEKPHTLDRYKVITIKTA